MKFKRGDLVLVNFPHSDLTTIKLRSVLIVQAENLGTGLAQIVVACQPISCGYSVQVFSSPEAPVPEPPVTDLLLVSGLFIPMVGKFRRWKNAR